MIQYKGYHVYYFESIGNCVYTSELTLSSRTSNKKGVKWRDIHPSKTLHAQGLVTVPDELISGPLRWAQTDCRPVMR